MADRLLDGLSTVPEIKELLTEYGKYQKELESYYQMHPDEPQPLSAVAARSNLYMLKNLVIRCALQADTLDLDAGDVKTGSTSGFLISSRNHAAADCGYSASRRLARSDGRTETAHQTDRFRSGIQAIRRKHENRTT
ncbi:MAG: hypothetical protein ACLTD8_04265 [Acutalibacteraceae bacterium]